MLPCLPPVVLLGAVLGLGPPPPPRAEEGSTLSLGVGTQRVLTVPGITRIALGDPSVAEVKTLGSSQVLVIGQAEGRTSLLIWKASGQRLSYRVAVHRQDPQGLAGELEGLLGDIEGVRVRTAGGRIYLDGQAYTPPDARRIEQVLQLYPEVKSFVTLAPGARQLSAQALQGELQRAGLPGVQVKVVGDSLFLEGAVDSAQELQKAERVVQAVGEKVENLLVVGIRRMILSEVQFLEVRRSSRDRIGIRYPTDVSGSVSATAGVTQLLPAGAAAQGAASVAASASADFSLGFQANDGNARLLAEPRLVCASGEQAEFLAGGQVPIPLITNNQFSVEYKDYGIILRIRPTADGDGNIQTHVEAEASEVDTSVAVSVGGNATIPGFRTRRVATHVTVRPGETIVLSGVFSHDQQKAVSRLPGLGHLPIIGELFKNRAFDSAERELVILVTPRLVTPGSERVRSLAEGTRGRYERARGDVRFNLFD